MKKPKKNAKWLQQKRAKKNAKRKRIKLERFRKQNDLINLLNKMSPEELKEYLGEEAYQKLMAEVEDENVTEAVKNGDE